VPIQPTKSSVSEFLIFAFIRIGSGGRQLSVLGRDVLAYPLTGRTCDVRPRRAQPFAGVRYAGMWLGDIFIDYRTDALALKHKLEFVVSFGYFLPGRFEVFC
jgi:hypothetical protein